MKSPPPSSTQQRFCFQYVNADDAKRSIDAVLQRLKWEFQFYPHLSTWIAHKMHPQGDRGTVSLRVQLYTWPTQLHQEGGLVEVLRRYGEREILMKLGRFEPAVLSRCWLVITVVACDVLYVGNVIYP